MVYSTFREACLHRNLLHTDERHVITLREVATFKMPQRLRQLFAHILLYCDVSDPWDLWMQFRDDLMEDHIRNGLPDRVAESQCLIDIQSYLNAGRKTLQHFDLPEIQIPCHQNPITFDIATSSAEADRLESTLNQDQPAAAEAIMNSFATTNPLNQTCFT